MRIGMTWSVYLVPLSLYTPRLAPAAYRCDSVLQLSYRNSFASTSDNVATYTKALWFCEASEESIVSESNAGLSITVPIEGVPVNFAPSFSTSDARQKKQQYCGSVTSSSFARQFLHVDQSVLDPAVKDGIAAWRDCVLNEDRGLGVDVTPKKEPGAWQVQLRPKGPTTVKVSEFDISCAFPGFAGWFGWKSWKKTISDPVTMDCEQKMASSSPQPGCTFVTDTIRRGRLAFEVETGGRQFPVMGKTFPAGGGYCACQSNGSPIDVNNDPQHCGSCTTPPCASGQCSQGRCVPKYCTRNTSLGCARFEIPLGNVGGYAYGENEDLIAEQLEDVAAGKVTFSLPGVYLQSTLRRTNGCGEQCESKVTIRYVLGDATATLSHQNPTGGGSNEHRIGTETATLSTRGNYRFTAKLAESKAACHRHSDNCPTDVYDWKSVTASFIQTGAPGIQPSSVLDIAP